MVVLDQKPLLAEKKLEKFEFGAILHDSCLIPNSEVIPYWKFYATCTGEIWGFVSGAGKGWINISIVFHLSLYLWYTKHIIVI